MSLTNEIKEHRAYENKNMFLRRNISCISKDSTEERESFLSLIETSKIKDFRNCECLFVQYDAYNQLVHHSTMAGLKLKQIKFLIQQGTISITMGNNIEAIALLSAAKYLSENGSQKLNLPKATRRLYSAEIYTLLGQAYLDLGNLEEAKISLQKSLQKFGISYPKTKLTAQIALQWQYYRLMLFHIKFSRGFVPFDRDVTSGIKASTFSHLTNIYTMEEKWILAELSALLSLNFAHQSNDLCELCGAYSNVMEICHHYGRLKYNKKLEDAALVIVKTLYSGSQVKELVAICHLYWAITTSRLLRGELESSLQVGSTILKICDKICNNYIKITILPTLIHVLIMNDGLHEGVDLLKILLFEGKQDTDQSSHVWYHALCLDVLLDTGCTIEKAEICKTYAQRLLIKHNASFSSVAMRDKTSILRLIVSMWVLSIRLHKHTDSKIWGQIAAELIRIEDDDSFSNFMTYLRYLEGLLLCSVLEMKAHQAYIQYLRFTAISVIRKLERISKTVNVIQPSCGTVY